MCTHFRIVGRVARKILGVSVLIASLIMAGCAEGGSRGRGGSDPLSVTITNKLATVNAGGSAITFNATVQNDPTSSGVSWTLSTQGETCEPGCGQLSNASLTSVQYAPPRRVMGVPNNRPTLTAIAAYDGTKFDSDTFTINAAPAGAPPPMEMDKSPVASKTTTAQLPCRASRSIPPAALESLARIATAACAGVPTYGAPEVKTVATNVPDGTTMCTGRGTLLKWQRVSHVFSTGSS
jgi:hypothetical protein